jgi:hypothetical protein
MRKRLTLLALAAAVAGGALLLPVGGGPVDAPASLPPAPRLDLSAFSEAPPAAPVPLLFIHHSCGGQLLAPVGAEAEAARCIYTSHPNGGGLRPLLEAQGYTVNEASYGSAIGDETDLFDWLPKFRDQMEAVLRVARNDTPLPEGQRNEIVVFKSCYTQSELEAGEGPGEPAGPALTVPNAKATLTGLLPHFQKRPDVLFVYLTSPPLAPAVAPVRAWKWLARKVLGKPDEAERLREKGRLARELATWVRSPEGWLAGYPLKNVVVFDYHDILTGDGASDLLRYPPGEGRDSHPAAAGNDKAARAFVPFLNRALARHRASQTPPSTP